MGESTVSPYTFTWSSPAAGTYLLTAKATDDKGAVTTSGAVTITVDVSSNTPVGTGLTATYYNNKDLSGSAVLSQVEATVDADWGMGSPAAAVNMDQFSARWTGQVLAPVSGDYTFTTVSDDGVRLPVNGQQVINNWTDHPPTADSSAAVSLVAGQKYAIQLEYYENGGGAVCRLQWCYPGQTTQAIPQSQLFPTTSAATLRSATAAVAPKQRGASSQLEVFPNPASEQLTFSTSLARADDVQLRLTGSFGRTVRQRTQAAQAGGQRWSLDVRGLPQGLYLLQVQQGAQVLTQKVLIQP